MAPFKSLGLDGGKQFGALVPKRGLRQGALLSLYFFSCVQNHLVPYCNMLNKCVRFRVGQLVGGSSISRHLFADDTRIFCWASLESTQAISDALEVYRHASGQEINFSKSLVAFSKNKNEALCLHSGNTLTIRRENKMELYLDLPSRAARSKRDIFATIHDRVWYKIIWWNEKLLSHAGRRF
ncbi:UNVERIFIED_CONTAM: hypothetical protein Sradi_4003900 [Sesamum radiatum]|uniref:Reverse transcriptase domain-containing protein n=1 Tax=Sesamum radiatum TaxID=300843 RepID=A0AAW2PK46_SESRA